MTENTELNLPAFFNARETEDGTKYGVKFEQMQHDDTVVLTIAREPEQWPQIPSNYDDIDSRLGIFMARLPDGQELEVTAFVSMNTDKLRSDGPGRNLWSVFSDLSEGDTVRVRHELTEVQSGKWKGKPLKLYHVERDFQ